MTTTPGLGPSPTPLARALARAALGGIAAGLAACGGGSNAGGSNTVSLPSIPAAPTASAAIEQPEPRRAHTPARPPPRRESNCCKGKNECKGKGGCKTDRNECKGMNECKGLGGCKMGDCDRP